MTSPGCCSCEGWGRYTFPNSHYYEGEFFNNQFHGKGTMVFPETGRFEGWWEKGCCVKGTYMFGDGLKNDDQQWGYCTESDRRLLSEIKEGLKPAGVHGVDGRAAAHEGANV
eukprot:TRINITY_DN5765_c0_g1_i7.p2 TRINITY_DN5765_c0_g1~~TRINITY_DN5765_c0_g1_i7.p2  ORF type:complete len:112 (-),score=19.25 TRINITY_DN5765_c0_g1_i7:291-626(-)